MGTWPENCRDDLPISSLNCTPEGTIKYHILGPRCNERCHVVTPPQAGHRPPAIGKDGGVVAIQHGIQEIG